MGQALYRKYRPKKLQDIIGQEHITTTLKHSIDSGSLSHAYLLTGPRGVGKTSIARILAHEINKLDYDETANHLDIIEIDAASNRRIDEIRELRDKVNILPSQVEYKVYIIDEVHMLTREAFNALLKTLEEPPKHAIFILATTEAHKLPDTIISRTQHFTFKPIDDTDLYNHLKSIAKSENISIDDEAIKLIASHGDGSFRDSIGLLDQTATNNTQITIDTVQQMLGLAPRETITQIIDSLKSTDPKELIEKLTDLRERGVQTGVLSKQLSEHLRSNIINDAKFRDQKYLRLLEAIINSSGSVNPERQLEIELLDFVISFGQVSEETKPKPASTEALKQETIKKVEQKKEGKPAKEQPTSHKQVESQESEEDSPIDNEVFSSSSKNATSEKQPEKISEPKEPNELDIELDSESWPVILNAVKQKYNTLYGVLRMADTSFEENKLVLSFKFPFHKKKIDDSKNKKIISDLIRTKTGQDMEIIVQLTNKVETPKPAVVKKSKAISNVSDIFGGAELLES